MNWNYQKPRFELSDAEVQQRLDDCSFAELTRVIGVIMGTEGELEREHHAAGTGHGVDLHTLRTPLAGRRLKTGKVRQMQI